MAATPFDYFGLDVPTPKRSEQDALIQAMIKARESGERAAFERLRNRVTTANLRLVALVARRYRNLGLEDEDLLSVGAMGLLGAVEAWEPGRAKLSTFAVPRIRQAILRAIDNLARAIRVPVERIDGARSLAKHSRKFQALTGREPTAAELAKAAARPLRPVQRDLDAAAISCTSIDAPHGIGNDGETVTLHDSHPDPTPSVESVLIERERVAVVREVLTDLPDRERSILASVVGDGATLDAVGMEWKICRERVRQVRDEALVRVKRSHRHLFTALL